MSMLVFAFLTDLRAEFVELARNLLIVLGGFLLGYLLGGVLGWAAGRWVFRSMNPELAQKVGRPFGGIILALVVALIVFTGKGKPDGEGGEGAGNTGSESKSGAFPKAEPSPQVNARITTHIDEKASNTIRVTILAGLAVPAEGKFYVLGDDSRDQAKSFTELKRAIEERMKKQSGKMYLAIVFPSNPNDAPPREDKRVTSLQEWANNSGLDVVFPSNR